MLNETMQDDMRVFFVLYWDEEQRCTQWLMEPGRWAMGDGQLVMGNGPPGHVTASEPCIHVHKHKSDRVILICGHLNNGSVG